MAKWPDEIEGQRLHPESLMMSYGYRPEWSEFAAVSLDLIFAAPTETLQQWQEDLELAIGQRPQHLCPGNSFP